MDGALEDTDRKPKSHHFNQHTKVISANAYNLPFYNTLNAPNECTKSLFFRFLISLQPSKPSTSDLLTLQRLTRKALNSSPYYPLTSIRFRNLTSYLKPSITLLDSPDLLSIFRATARTRNSSCLFSTQILQRTAKGPSSLVPNNKF